jgi:hypothetical protein
LKRPEAIRDLLTQRYRNQRRSWLRGEGQWPLIVTLGRPTEAEARQLPEVAHAWVTSWQQWEGPGELTWCERRWRSIGTQRLPDQLILKCPADVAAWIDETERWTRARSRYERFTEHWPKLARTLSHYFDVLAQYSDSDVERLHAVLTWLESHPHSSLYPRQLPIAGLDTKWLESRRALVTDLIDALTGGVDHSSPVDTTATVKAATAADFYRLCGLRPLPTTLRVLVLDRDLRQRIGGLRDITVPVDELANSALSAKHFYIVENIQTALAFGDLPGSIVIMGLGYSVDVLSRIPFLEEAECTYWGDLDTHGLAILNRARAHLPHVRSLMMDEATLLKYRPLWSTESEQVIADDLPNLTPPEHALFSALKQQRWATNVRLEQERINWHDAWQLLSR